MRSSFSCAIGAVAVLLAVSACSKPAPDPWTRLDLPGRGTFDLRDVTDCAGRSYAAGAPPAPDGTAPPAAWTSTDATTWTAVPFHPLASSYYGPHQVIMSVACTGGQVAVIGG